MYRFTFLTVSTLANVAGTNAQTCTTCSEQQVRDVMELEQEADNTCDGRRSTDDIGKFITLSVHLYAPEAARRAGPSASANTCIRPIPEIYRKFYQCATCP